jgi:uncharacterized protein DUF1559
MESKKTWPSILLFRLLDLVGLIMLAAVLVFTTVCLWEIADTLLGYSLPWIAIAAVLIIILPGRRFIHFAMIATVIHLVICFLGTAVITPGCVSKRCQCANNLKQILMALHGYHDEHGSFPPAYVADKNGEPMHSWRVLILPYLDRQDLYDHYDFNEPWDCPKNRRLLSSSSNPYQCPEQREENSSEANYVAVIGPRTAWPGDEPTKVADFADGTSTTLVVVEVVDSGIAWTEPKDLTIHQAVEGLQQGGGLAIGSGHTFSNHLYAPTLGAHLGYADGHLELLLENAPSDQWREVLQLDDGKPTARSSYYNFNLSDGLR